MSKAGTIFFPEVVYLYKASAPHSSSYYDLKRMADDCEVQYSTVRRVAHANVKFHHDHDVVLLDNAIFTLTE